MKILVAIADHGTKNRKYLDRLLQEFESFDHDVDLIVLSDIPKDDLADHIEVNVGAPIEDPWSLPFAHRPIFIERADDYDLFIYTENDTLITQRNVDAFMEITATLEDDEVLGFMRSEEDPEGRLCYPMIHRSFRWLPESYRERGGEKFATLTNEHSACYLLTRDQLRRCIESGGYATVPHVARHDMLCTAACDPYLQCGLTKLICTTRIEDCMLPHLSNRYTDVRGVTQVELDWQLDALHRIGAEPGWKGPLYMPEREKLGLRYWKDLYETEGASWLDFVPMDATSVLVVGSGWGLAERALADRGKQVVGLALDPVLGRMAEHRGLEVVCEDLASAPSKLGEGRFDCVVFPWMLHLVDSAVDALASFRPTLEEGGTIIVTSPNMVDVKSRYRRSKGLAYFDLPEGPGEADRIVGWSKLRDWVTAAGYQIDEMQGVAGPDRMSKLATKLSLPGAWFSPELVVRARAR